MESTPALHQCPRTSCDLQDRGAPILYWTHDHSLDFLIATRGSGRAADASLCRHDRVEDQAGRYSSRNWFRRDAGDGPSGRAGPARLPDRRIDLPQRTSGRKSSPALVAAEVMVQCLACNCRLITVDATRFGAVDASGRRRMTDDVQTAGSNCKGDHQAVSRRAGQ